MYGFHQLDAMETTVLLLNKKGCLVTMGLEVEIYMINQYMNRTKKCVSITKVSARKRKRCNFLHRYEKCKAFTKLYHYDV